MSNLQLAFALFLFGCANQEKPPPKIEMVHMDPPADTPSAKPAAEDASRDPHRIELSVGAIATFPAESVKSYSAANDKVDVRLTPDGKTFVVAGKIKGRCDLLLLHKNGTQEIFTIEVYDR